MSVGKLSVGPESRKGHYDEFMLKFTGLLRMVGGTDALVKEYKVTLDSSAKEFLEQGWSDPSLRAIKEQYYGLIPEIDMLLCESGVSPTERKRYRDQFDSIYKTFALRLECEAWENDFSREFRSFEGKRVPPEEEVGPVPEEGLVGSVEWSKKEERLPLGRRIADAIPDKYSKHIAVGILCLLLLTLGFHFYNSFWGKRSMERKVESLQIELRQKDQDIDILKRGGRQEALLDEVREAARNYDESALDTPQDTLLLEAYTKDVDPILPE